MAESVGEACRAILEADVPAAKLRLARAAARRWRSGALAHGFSIAMPDRPAVPARPLLLPPRLMVRRGKAGSLRGRIALLHAVAHIEYSAIDLAFDLIGRFGADFPRAFVDDWMRVGAQEAMHFALLDRRLSALGARYGDLPAHDGLWAAAAATRDDAAARLAVVPLVLEARGLDVTPPMIDRLEAAGDLRSSAILRRILSDEIGHVGTGVRWFRHAVTHRSLDPAATFQALVSGRFRHAIKAPFNDSARDEAGLTREYYAAIAD